MGMVVGVSDGRRSPLDWNRKRKRKSKRAKEQRIGRHPAGPGRADVLRIEPAGAVSTLGRSSLTRGSGGDGGFRPEADAHRLERLIHTRP